MTFSHFFFPFCFNLFLSFLMNNNLNDRAHKAGCSFLVYLSKLHGVWDLREHIVEFES